jgi:hypothetical protein
LDGVAVRNVKQLPSAEKRSLENLVGRLEDDQQVFILAFTPATVPIAEARQTALRGLNQTWAKVEQHMQKHGITAEESDAAVDEAVDNVRHGQD